MDRTEDLRERAAADFQGARTRFEAFERFYRALDDGGRRYLAGESARYKGALREVQALILPAVRTVCPNCDPQCCRLYTPERSIYIAGTVGGFHLQDYLLARCDLPWPEPRYENAARNLCPFWEGGCRLPPEGRSYLCIQYFCNSLEKVLDMAAVTAALKRLQGVLETFSVGRCLG